MGKISHLNENGEIRMVDVGAKEPSHRRASAQGVVLVGGEIMTKIQNNETPKGNIFEAARIAGIMAAKRTYEMIPLCHQLPLDDIKIDFELEDVRIVITASASTKASTGVEMEALTAVSIAALTIYDMLKALSHSIIIESIRLLTKSGGKSGDYQADDYSSEGKKQ